MYRNKSIPLDLVDAMSESCHELGLIELHCLQFGDDSDQLNPWRHMESVLIGQNRLQDFSDTAYVVRQLDLVICIDTAVAHLAGA